MKHESYVVTCYLFSNNAFEKFSDIRINVSTMSASTATQSRRKYVLFIQGISVDSCAHLNTKGIKM